MRSSGGDFRCLRKEIGDRVRAVEEGTAIGIDYDEAMQKLKRALKHEKNNPSTGI